MKELKIKLFSIMASLTLLLNSSNVCGLKSTMDKNLIDGKDIVVVSVYNPALEQDVFYLMTKQYSTKEKPYDKDNYDVANQYFARYYGVDDSSTLYDTYTWYEKDDVITIKTNLYLEDLRYNISYNNEEVKSAKKDNTNRTYSFSSGFSYVVSSLPLVENPDFIINEDYVSGTGEEEYKIETYPFSWFYSDGYYTYEELVDMQNELNQKSKTISLILDKIADLNRN